MSPSGDPTDDLPQRKWTRVRSFAGVPRYMFGIDHELRSITMMLITVWSFDDCTWHWGDFGIVHAASMGAHWNFRKAFTKDPLKTVADHSLMLLNNRTMVEAVDLYMVDSRVSVASPVQWIQRAQTI